MTNPFNPGAQAAPAGYGAAPQAQPAAPAPQPQYQAPADQAAPAPQYTPPAAPVAQPAEQPVYTPPAAPAAQPQATPAVGGIQTSPQAAAPAVNLAERFAHGTAGGGDKLLSDDNLGRPVVVRPISVETGMQTSFGQTDAIRAEWIFLDTFAQTGQAEVNKGLIFPSAVVRALGDVIANPRVDYTIGMITKASSAKPGQSPAWLLDDAPEWVDTAVQAINAGGMY
ncbi:hypothetical protein FGG66_gp38 [Corynebacterium phage phi674]|uniref:Uncharacterized protein n=1 Tax=Corynebacterium phage phi674 TaxID=2052822 RepID=A0A2H4PJ28_9CAUD|nr:hypothetical protein FGG66_gp38 [Corynebacterium phage phi674]ATW62956.1 hypothetical protein phi674_gp38 [Corynebacterium phage phi674]